MKSHIQKWSILLLLMVLVPAMALAQDSAVQIRTEGGSASRDGVSILKTISSTPKENLFDITLQVETVHSLDQLRQAEDAAVVIVMDISATMNQKLEGESGPSRLSAAKAAASAFVRQFCDENRMLGANREMGFVTFNRDASTLFPLEKATQARGEAWQESIDGLVAPPSTTGLGWTNIEAGLKLAHNLIKQSSSPHKFILLLSDGFPTTYLTSGADESGMQSLPGRDPTHGFWDRVKNVECTMGTSYSETGAQRAREAALAIKADGVDVFSIGVGLGSPIQVGDRWVPETIQAHIDRITWNASVVERPANAANPGYVYEIGAANDPDSYRYWLGGRSANGGIGGGPHFSQNSELRGVYGAYADANDEEALQNAFGALLKEIESINSTAIRDTWFAADPMGAFVDFEHFLEAGENAVSFSDNAIQWELLSSPFTMRTEGTSTFYTYTLRYRVRLRNELPAFQSATTGSADTEPSYLTNGDASLHYKVEENGRLSEDRTLLFAKPAVEGYLGELRFQKNSTENGGAHPGVLFVLEHGSDCAECGGSIPIAPLSGVSGPEGQVLIASVPSAHTYRLTEPESDGYKPKEHTVSVSYGEVLLQNASGEAVDTITNELLPAYLGFTAHKRMDGDIPQEGAFTFELTDAQGSLLQTKTNGADGRIVFDELAFSAPGLYTFRMREVKGDAGIVFDTSVYTITVEVTKTPEGCAARVASTQKNGEAFTGEMVFDNRTQTPPPPAPVPTPPVPKTGDEASPLLWGLLLLLSGAGIAALLVWRKKA